MIWKLGMALAGMGGIAVLLYVVGLGGVVRLFRALLDLVMDALVRFVRWLKVPGSKTRALCAVLAFGFMAMGLRSWQQGNVIVRQQSDYAELQRAADATARAADATARALRGDIANKNQAIAVFTQLAADQLKLLNQARRENEQAVEAARLAGIEAAKSEAKFQAAFQQRPPECKAALAIMASACPTLKDY